MKNTKVIQQIHSLDKTAQNRFVSFLNSPYYNVHQQVIELYHLLDGIVEETDVSKENIYAQIYGDEPYNDLRLRHLSSELSKLFEAFLVAEANSPNTHFEPILRHYMQHDMQKAFNRQAAGVTKQLAETAINDEEYYYQRYRLSSMEYAQYSRTQNRESRHSLKDTVAHLDNFHLLAKLKCVCELVNRANILNNSDETDWKAQIDREMLHIDQPSAAAKIYYLILLTLTEPAEEAHYIQLKMMLSREQATVSPSDLRDMYAYAQNYCVKKVNRGQTDYMQQLFELYQQLLQSGLILNNGQLSPFNYKNIVYIGLRLHRYQWVADFLEDYQGLLPPEHQRNAYIYNKAYYHFFKKEYNHTLDMLNDVRFRDVYYYLDSRSLLLKTFYELDETDALLSLIQSTHAYLRRNKVISAYQRVIYQNLLKFVKRLIKVQVRGKKDKQALLKKLEQETDVADKAWLKTKLHELAS